MKWRAFINTGILCVFLSVAAYSKVTVERIVYCGWQDSYRITAGAYSIVVVPEIGGRIMEYSLESMNALWENVDEFGKTYPIAKEWHNYGGYKTWVAPQSKWGWPPDPMLDFGKANVEIVENSKGVPTIKITGAASLKSGVMFTKEVSLTESGEVTLKQRMHNISGDTFLGSIWDVTQVGTPCFVVFPIRKQSRIPGGLAYLMGESKSTGQFVRNGDLCITRYLGEAGKIGSDSDGPWMIWFKDDLAYVKLFDPMQRGAQYPDGGCSVEVFTSDKEAGYVEMEILGPLVELEPGDSTELTEKWRIFRLTQPVTSEDRVIKAINGMRGKGWIP